MQHGVYAFLPSSDAPRKEAHCEDQFIEKKIRKGIPVRDYDVDKEEMRRVMEESGRVLTREEEHVLFRALYAANLDLDERDGLKQFLIGKNEGLVKELILRLHVPEDMFEDARHEGLLGLLAALADFDPEMGTKFSTHAFYFIRHAIGRARFKGGVIQTPHHWQSRVWHYQQILPELKETLGREPSVEEIASAMNLSVGEVERLVSFRGYKIVSLSKPVGNKRGDGDAVWGDFIGEEDSPVFIDDIAARMGVLSRRQQVIMKMRAGMGTQDNESYTLDRIAQIFRVTRERIRQIEASAVKKMRDAGPSTPKGAKFSHDHLDVYLVEVKGILPTNKKFEYLLQGQETGGLKALSLLLDIPQDVISTAIVQPSKAVAKSDDVKLLRAIWQKLAFVSRRIMEIHFGLFGERMEDPARIAAMLSREINTPVARQLTPDRVLFRLQRTIAQLRDTARPQAVRERVRRAIFLVAPDIIRRYENLNSLSEGDAERLRADIYALPLSLMDLANLTATSRNPLWGGSGYIPMLQLFFARLGLNPMGFGLDWRTEASALRSVRYMLAKKAPYIMQRYSRLDSLSEDDVERLKDDIYSLQKVHIQAWGLVTGTYIHQVPWFNGSYKEMLRRAFPRLKLNVLGWGPDWGTKDLGRASIRFRLERDLPGFRKDLSEFSGMPEAEKEKVRRTLYQLTQGDIKTLGLGSLLQKRAVPYWRGRLKEALMDTFPELGLDPLGFLLDWSNEQRGIASVRYVFLREIPHIVQEYEKRDDLDDEGISHLRDRILRIRSAHLNVWGLAAALNKRLAPYFHGDYREVVMAFFSDRRLNLTEEAFVKMRRSEYERRYSWGLGIEEDVFNIQDAVMRNRPDIMDRYQRRSRLSSKELELLREDIYAIHSGHFGLWGVGSVLDASKAPHFKGSYVHALLEVFSELGLKPLGFGLDSSSLEAGIRSIHYVIERQRPSIMRRYLKREHLNEGERSLLRRDIYLVSSAHFYAWGLDAVLEEGRIKEFEGKYSLALMKAFPDIGLNPLGFRLAMKTKEEALASTRFVLEENAPYLMHRYAMASELPVLEQEHLKEEIYGLARADLELWGLSFILDQKAFFKDGYRELLMTVFSALSLHRLGFGLLWKTKEMGLESVHYVLERKIPDVMRLYRNIENLSSEKIRALKKVIIGIQEAHLMYWGLGRATMKDLAPYFGGSYITVLMEVFAHPGLRLTRADFEKRKPEMLSRLIEELLKEQFSAKTEEVALPSIQQQPQSRLLAGQEVEKRLSGYDDSEREGARVYFRKLLAIIRRIDIDWELVYSLAVRMRRAYTARTVRLSFVEKDILEEAEAILRENGFEFEEPRHNISLSALDEGARRFPKVKAGFQRMRRMLAELIEYLRDAGRLEGVTGPVFVADNNPDKDAVWNYGLKDDEVIKILRDKGYSRAESLWFVEQVSIHEKRLSEEAALTAQAKKMERQMKSRFWIVLAIVMAGIFGVGVSLAETTSSLGDTLREAGLPESLAQLAAVFLYGASVSAAFGLTLKFIRTAYNGLVWSPSAETLRLLKTGSDEESALAREGRKKEPLPLYGRFIQAKDISGLDMEIPPDISAALASLQPGRKREVAGVFPYFDKKKDKIVAGAFIQILYQQGLTQVRFLRAQGSLWYRIPEGFVKQGIGRNTSADIEISYELSLGKEGESADRFKEVFAKLKNILPGWRKKESRAPSSAQAFSRIRFFEKERLPLKRQIEIFFAALRFNRIMRHKAIFWWVTRYSESLMVGLVSATVLAYMEASGILTWVDLIALIFPAVIALLGGPIVNKKIIEYVLDRRDRRADEKETSVWERFVQNIHVQGRIKQAYRVYGRVNIVTNVIFLILLPAASFSGAPGAGLLLTLAPAVFFMLKIILEYAFRIFLDFLQACEEEVDTAELFSSEAAVREGFSSYFPTILAIEQRLLKVLNLAAFFLGYGIVGLGLLKYVLPSVFILSGISIAAGLLYPVFYGEKHGFIVSFATDIFLPTRKQNMLGMKDGTVLEFRPKDIRIWSTIDPIPDGENSSWLPLIEALRPVLYYKEEPRVTLEQPRFKRPYILITSGRAPPVILRRYNAYPVSLSDVKVEKKDDEWLVVIGQPVMKKENPAVESHNISLSSQKTGAQNYPEQAIGFNLM
ncbi:MAG: sigma-70 family RNA polymerase sigma factor [Candidatus Omnitrophica bacterium]|nr:sigma-70 family RNA polymerase sigma factor [Candidatus Omnitrophota bacterium]